MTEKCRKSSRRTLRVRKLNDYTESEILSIIDGISNRLAPKYVFPGYDLEDIKQEAVLLGIEGLEDYDEEYRLSSFLFTHINNRLKTLKRNEYFRMEQGTAKKIQDRKKRICSPEGFSDQFFTCEADETIDRRDLIEKISRELPVENRSDFLRVLNGERIPQTRKNTLMERIENILRSDLDGI